MRNCSALWNGCQNNEGEHRTIAGRAREIARRSRGTPRIANRLLRRVRDYAEIQRAALSHERWQIQALHLLKLMELDWTRRFLQYFRRLSINSMEARWDGNFGRDDGRGIRNREDV